jgi:ribosomal protein S19E (S16A)
MPKRLSPAQVSLLRSAALGKVWRDEYGCGRRPLYAWCVEGDSRVVSKTFNALHDAGLTAIDFTKRNRPVAVVTDAGRALLDEIRDTTLAEAGGGPAAGGASS